MEKVNFIFLLSIGIVRIKVINFIKYFRENPDKRRFCPNNDCHILIEKAEGCNHMECPMCKVHFCWLCMDYRVCFNFY